MSKYLEALLHAIQRYRSAEDIVFVMQVLLHLLFLYYDSKE